MLMNVSDVYFVVAGAEDVLAGNVSPLHHSRVHQGRNHENWKKNPLGCVSISKPIIFQDPNPVKKAGRRMVSAATSGAQEKRTGTMPKTFARWRAATLPLLDPKPLDDIWKKG